MARRPAAIREHGDGAMTCDFCLGEPIAPACPRCGRLNVRYPDPATPAEHDFDCRRYLHGGPCRGPLRYELPETADERWQRHREAVRCVLIRHHYSMPDAVIDEILAAADTGI
jgi:hypothetical protein